MNISNLFLVAGVFLCSSALAGEKILLGDALADLDLQAQKTISDARLAGDLVLENAALKLATAIDLARVNYSQALKETLDSVDPKISNFMGEINALMHQIEEIDGKAQCISNNVALEIKTVLSSMPLVDSGPPSIQSVSGFELTYGNDLLLRISGTDIHPASENYKTEATVHSKDNGGDVIPSSIKIPKSGNMEIMVPKVHFEPYFQDESVTFFPIEVEISRFKKRWYGLLPLIDNFDLSTQKISLDIVLLPEKSAKLKVTATVPVFGWSKTASETVSWTGPNHHCSDDCGGHYGGWSQQASRVLPGGNQSHPQEGDQRIISVSGLSCQGAGCAYDTDRTTWIDSNNRRAIGKYRARSRPTTNSFVFQYQTWSLLGTEAFEQDFSLRRGLVSELFLPVNAENIIIQGVSSFNQPLSISADFGSDRNPVISNINTKVVGDKKIVSVVARDLLGFTCD